MAALVWIVSLVIICITVLLGIYMYCCYQNDINMFADPRYEERITKLERKVKELKEKDK